MAVIFMRRTRLVVATVSMASRGTSNGLGKFTMGLAYVGLLHHPSLTYLEAGALLGLGWRAGDGGMLVTHIFPSHLMWLRYTSVGTFIASYLATYVLTRLF